MIEGLRRSCQKDWGTLPPTPTVKLLQVQARLLLGEMGSPRTGEENTFERGGGILLPYHGLDPTSLRRISPAETPHPALDSALPGIIGRRCPVGSVTLGCLWLKVNVIAFSIDRELNS